MIKFRKKLSEVYDTDTHVVKVWPLNFYYEPRNQPNDRVDTLIVLFVNF